MDFKTIKIITDGACSGNPGPGGWGAIVVYLDGRVQELGAHAPETTNNRMELLAIIKALESVKSIAEPIDIYTDSVYAIRGITQWIWGWKKRGWKNAEGADVLNRDLFEWLHELVLARPKRSELNWHYVRGHTGIPANERVDEIAVCFSQRKSVQLYSGPLNKYPVAVLDLPEDTSLPEMRDYNTPKQKPIGYLSLVDGILKRHATWNECQLRVKGRSGAKFKKAMSTADERAILKSWGLDENL